MVKYCQAHTPGTFIGFVKNQLANGAITNRGIHLNHFTFYVSKKNGIYFMHGTVDATKYDKKNKLWVHHIHYYVYKLTKYGETRGVWSSVNCKGLFFGKVIGYSK